MLLVYFSAQTTWALVLLGLVVLLAVVVAVQAHRHRASGGNEELPGMVGEVTEPSDARGRAWAMVRGEAWQVHADQPLSAGQSIRVLAVRGLRLEVEPVLPIDVPPGDSP